MRRHTKATLRWPSPASAVCHELLKEFRACPLGGTDGRCRLPIAVWIQGRTTPTCSVLGEGGGRRLVDRWSAAMIKLRRIESMGLPDDRCELYLRLLHRERSPLVVLTNNRLRVVFGDLRVSEPIPVDLPVPHGNRILLKLEHLAETAPTGSFYDRVFPWLFLRAEADGFIQPGRTPIIEASVGNAGAAFAYVARELGYRRPIVLLPKDIYGARKQQILDLGAEVRYSPPRIGPIGYIHMLERMLADDWRKHGRPSKGGRSLYAISKIRKVPSHPYRCFLHEVLLQLHYVSNALQPHIPPRVDTYAFGVGSGNTISQVGLALKRANPSARVLVGEHEDRPFVRRYLDGKAPDDSPGWPEPDWPATTIHGVPLRKLSLDLDVIDDVIMLSLPERERAWSLANDELGLGAGRPGGGCLAAALRAAEMTENQNILTIIFDSVHKYAARFRPPLSVLALPILTQRRRCGFPTRIAVLQA